MNKYTDRVFVIPEDDANRQIANGFVRYFGVDERRIMVMPPAGGWSKVLETFRDEYIQELRKRPNTHVVMLIDFDDQVEKRKADFDQEIPTEFKARVFVIGSKHTPETLKKEANKNFEEIGKAMAEDCNSGTVGFWDHEQLSHNDADRQRLVVAVRPFLFRQ